MARIGLLAALVIALLCASAPAASAAIGITDFQITTLPNANTPDPNVAGAHPDVRIYVDTDQDDPASIPERARNMKLVLPAGMVIDLKGAPRCPRSVFLSLNTPCPTNTKVGRVDVVRFTGGATPDLFNVEPMPGEAGALGIRRGSAVDIYGISTATVGPEDDYRIDSFTEGFWMDSFIRTMTIDIWAMPPGATRPVVTNPTRCDVAATADVAIDSYQAPDVYAEATDAMDPLTGCESLPFSPSASVDVARRTAGAPSGLEVDIAMPHDFSAAGRGSDVIRKAVLELPEGMRVSASSANGLAACSAAQIAVRSDDAPSCPDASKIGTVRVETHLLDGPLTGNVYLASQGDNPFGSLLAVYLVAHGHGVMLKLPGRVDVDPATGRLTITFDDNPQMPFTKLEVDLKTGPRAPLSNPPACGNHTASMELTSWSGKTVTSESVFSTSSDGNGGACVAPAFSPDFTAGTLNPVAGSFSPLVSRVVRPDGGRELDRIDMALPKGLLAKLRGVSVCSNAQAALAAARSGAASQQLVGCPANSQIGSVTVGAGPGSDPYYLRLPGSDVSGRVFLTEAYGQGAEYGLAIEVPAVAGPLDLGNVMVRARVDVDPDTAALKVVSDSLPTMLQGIPLQLRDVRITIDRPRFTVNPTSCEPTKIDSTLHAVGGGSVDRSSRFQVGECVALGFTPKLALRLTGKGQRREGGHPGLRAVLTQPSGQANVDRVEVTLPKSVALDPENANGLCSYEDGLKSTCPEASRIGTATASTPLLERPLTGPVYFVQGVRFDPETGNRIRTLPTLLTTLRGEIAINLRATSSVRGGKLVSTFGAVPDAAVSKFSLRLNGGQGGILAATGRPSLCTGRHVANVEAQGHNGRTQTFGSRIKTPCPKGRARR